MISAADFADVLPWMVEKEATRDQGVIPTPPRQNREASRGGYDECVARWEDDGGRVPNFSQTGTLQSSKTTHSEHPVTSLVVTKPLFPILAPLIIYRTAAEYFASQKT